MTAHEFILAELSKMSEEDQVELLNLTRQFGDLDFAKAFESTLVEANRRVEAMELNEARFETEAELDNIEPPTDGKRSEEGPESSRNLDDSPLYRHEEDLNR